MNVSSAGAASRAVKGKGTWIFDLDGVIYNGKDAIPGAREAIDRLQGLGKRVVFLTNNSTRTRAQYVDRLRGMGIEARVEDVFTSAWITARWLDDFSARAGMAKDQVLVYVIGEQGIKHDVASFGFGIIDEGALDADPTLHARVTTVIVGLDRQFTYKKLQAALTCIVQGGASFIATNDDASLPVEGGGVAPGAGAIVQAVATCTGRAPEHGSPFGKPNPAVIDVIEHATGTGRDDMIMVGDRLETDILAARRAGVTSVLVLTGITRIATPIPAGHEPDVILPSIDAIPALLRG